MVGPFTVSSMCDTRVDASMRVRLSEQLSTQTCAARGHVAASTAASTIAPARSGTRLRSAHTMALAACLRRHSSAVGGGSVCVNLHAPSPNA
eukprot:6202327-Pleurochrysis_carterae.AAC.2